MKSKRVHYARKYRSRKNKAKYGGGADNIFNEAMAHINSPGLVKNAMNMEKNIFASGLTGIMPTATSAQESTATSAQESTTAAAVPPTTQIIINTGPAAGPAAGAGAVALPQQVALPPAPAPPPPAALYTLLEKGQPTPGYEEGLKADKTRADPAETDLVTISGNNNEVEEGEVTPTIVSPETLAAAPLTTTDAVGDVNAFLEPHVTVKDPDEQGPATAEGTTTEQGTANGQGTTTGLGPAAAEGGNRRRSSRRNKKSKSKTHKRKSKRTRRRSNK